MSKIILSKYQVVLVQFNFYKHVSRIFNFLLMFLSYFHQSCILVLYLLYIFLYLFTYTYVYVHLYVRILHMYICVVYILVLYFHQSLHVVYVNSCWNR